MPGSLKSNTEIISMLLFDGNIETATLRAIDGFIGKDSPRPILLTFRHSDKSTGLMNLLLVQGNLFSFAKTV